MPSDTEDEQPSSSRVEKMLNALNELQEAVDRLAAENRTASQRATHDLAPVEPLPGEELGAPKLAIDWRPGRRET